MDTSNNIPRWAFITEWITIIATLLTCFGFLYSHMNTIEARLDKRIENQEASLLAQSKRSDQLYIMFIELVKEKK